MKPGLTTGATRTGRFEVGGAARLRYAFDDARHRARLGLSRRMSFRPIRVNLRRADGLVTNASIAGEPAQSAVLSGADRHRRGDERGWLHRFHTMLQVRKSSPQHDGLQRNAILAAFGVLKDLDLVTAGDDDIDIRDLNDVEYAVAIHMEP